MVLSKETKKTTHKKSELLTKMIDYVKKYKPINNNTMLIDVNKKIQLKYKLTVSKQPPDYLEYFGFYPEYIHAVNSFYNILKTCKYRSYTRNKLISYNTNDDYDYEKILEQNLYKNTSSDKMLLYKLYNKYQNKNLENTFLESLAELDYTKKFDRNIDVINTGHVNDKILLYKNAEPIIKFIKNLIKKHQQDIKYDITLYEILVQSNYNLEKEPLQNILDNNINYLSTTLKSPSDIQYIVEQINDKKFDIIHLSSAFNFTNVREYQEQAHSARLFLTMVLGLKLQKKNGDMILLSMTYLTQITVQILYILNHFYESIKITDYENTFGFSISTKIIAKNFKGISNNEYSKLFKILLKWYTYDNTLGENPKKYVESILYLPIKLNDRVWLTNIVNFNKKKLETLKKYREIMSFICSNINKLEKTEKVMFFDELFKAQLYVATKWYINYDIINYI